MLGLVLYQNMNCKLVLLRFKSVDRELTSSSNHMKDQAPNILQMVHS